jgi:hypothetical protein
MCKKYFVLLLQVKGTIRQMIKSNFKKMFVTLLPFDVMSESF